MLSSFHVERILHGVWRWTSAYRRPDSAGPPEGLQREPTLLSHYGLREKDLPELLRNAWSLEPGHPLQGFVSLLERRIDNVVVRMGFAESVFQARELIDRGHILINRYPPKSSGLLLWPGDVIHFTLKPYDSGSVTQQFQKRPLPSYLQYLNPCTTDRGIMLSLPNLGHSPFPPFKDSPTPRCSQVSAHQFQENSMADSRILLAYSPQGAVFACQCGAVHIIVGDLAFSVSLEEFVVMLELHHQATYTLETNIVAVRELCRRRCDAVPNDNQTIH